MKINQEYKQFGLVVFAIIFFASLILLSVFCIQYVNRDSKICDYCDSRMYEEGWQYGDNWICNRCDAALWKLTSECLDSKGEPFGNRMDHERLKDIENHIRRR